MLRRGDKNKLVVGLCKAQLGGLREWEGKLKKQDWVAYANKFEMEEERSLLEHWLGEQGACRTRVMAREQAPLPRLYFFGLFVMIKGWTR